MLIQLDEYRRKKAALRSAPCQDEIARCVSRNPAASVVALSFYRKPQELSPQLPDEDAVIDAAVMDRIYALATQI